MYTARAEELGLDSAVICRNVRSSLVCVVRGEGVYLYDRNGQRCLIVDALDEAIGEVAGAL
jgi:hypothetical protein